MVGWCRGNRQFQGGGLLLSPPACALAPPLVDQAPRRDDCEPGSRLLRDSSLGPLHRRRDQRLLHGILTGVELPVAAHQRAEHLRCELAQEAFDRRFQAQKSGGASITRRTSMGTFTKSTMREAIATARSSFSTSTIQ